MNREETAIHRPSSNTRQAMWAWFLVGTSRSAVRGKQCFERDENTYVKCLGYDFFSFFLQSLVTAEAEAYDPPKYTK